METYSGYDYITLKEDLDIVYFRDVVEYMKKECSEDVIIKGITFHTQYTTTWRDRPMRSLGKFDNHISLTGNKKTDDIIISKADSIFKEWIDSQPKFKNFKQSEWQL